MSSPSLPDAAAKLLDFSQPFDVPLLDATINAFYGAGSNDEVRWRKRDERERKNGEEAMHGRHRKKSTSRGLLFLEAHPPP
jgi:hypothetical protein